MLAMKRIVFLSCFISCLHAAIVKIYEYSGSVDRIKIPNGSTRMLVNLYGASGGNAGEVLGGKGGQVQCLVDVQEMNEIFLFVGGEGGSRGGFNGGGNGGLAGSGGGGATDIRIGGYDDFNKIIVAGGGGGAYPSVHSTSTMSGGLLDLRGIDGSSSAGQGADNAKLGGGGGGGGWRGGYSLPGSHGEGGSSFAKQCEYIESLEGVNRGSGRAVLVFAVVSLPFIGTAQVIYVPDDVFRLRVTAVGARGGHSGSNRGGFGALVSATLHVYPGQELVLGIGGGGYNSTIMEQGSNGGGYGGEGSCSGGGATIVRKSFLEDSQDLLIAGGGGGGGRHNGHGGHGGAPIGGDGSGGLCEKDHAGVVACIVGGLGAPASVEEASSAGSTHVSHLSTHH